MAVLGGDAFGMELHAVDWQLAMAEAHDDAVLGFGADLQGVRQAVALDDKGVIARRLERRGDAGEQRRAAMADRAQLAVHQHRRAHDRRPERLADALVAETDAEHGQLARRGGDQVEADASLVRVAGPGREHDGVRRQLQYACRRDRIVAIDTGLRPQLAKEMNEVVGEAVVIID